jgi:hypothetical protein
VVDPDPDESAADLVGWIRIQEDKNDKQVTSKTQIYLLLAVLHIPDPNFSIPDLGQKYSGSRIRIRMKEFRYFNPKDCF